MSRQSTLDQLNDMKMTAMAKELNDQIANPGIYGTMSFEDRVSLMVNAEWNRRQENRLKNRLQEARLDNPSAAIEDVEYWPDRKLNKSMLMRLATCTFIKEEHHIILNGASGSGKSFIASALGNAACRKFYHVRYIRMPELLDKIVLARSDEGCRKSVRAYMRADLLIIDEWLLRRLTPQESYDMLEIIEARSKHGATIFCTQYNTDGWYERMNPDDEQGSPIADAIMDRIVHNAYVITIEGDLSMRERHGLYSDKNGGAV